MKVKFLLLPAAALGLWRGYIIARMTDGDTGFLPRSSPMGLAYTAAAAALCLWLYLAAWKNTSDDAGGSDLLAGGFFSFAGWLCAAGGLGFSAFLCRIDAFRWHLPVAVAAAVAALCALLLAPTASAMKRARGGADCFLSLGLVSWGVAALLAIFISNNTIASIPENTMSLLSMAAVTVALFADARLRAGVLSARRYMGYASAAALLVTSTQLPAFGLRLAGYAGKFVTRTSAVDLAMLALLPMLWAGLLAVERRAAGLSPAGGGEAAAQPEQE